MQRERRARAAGDDRDRVRLRRARRAARTTGGSGTGSPGCRRSRRRSRMLPGRGLGRRCACAVRATSRRVRRERSAIAQHPSRGPEIASHRHASIQAVGPIGAPSQHARIVTSMASFTFGAGNARKLLRLPLYALGALATFLVPRSARRWVFGSGIGLGEGALALYRDGARTARRRHPARLARDDGCRTRRGARARSRGGREALRPRLLDDPPRPRARRHPRLRRRQPLRHPRRPSSCSSGTASRSSSCTSTPPRRCGCRSCPITAWCAALIARAYRLRGSRDHAVPGRLRAGRRRGSRARSAFPRDRVVVTGDPRDDVLLAGDPATAETRRARAGRGARGGCSARSRSCSTRRPGATARPTRRSRPPTSGMRSPTGSSAPTRCCSSAPHPLGARRLRAPEPGVRTASGCWPSTALADVTPVLAGFDALVTDYSSIAFDFALVGRPERVPRPRCRAVRATRGLYEPYRDFSGGPPRHELGSTCSTCSTRPARDATPAARIAEHVAWLRDEHVDHLDGGATGARAARRSLAPHSATRTPTDDPGRRRRRAPRVDGDRPSSTARRRGSTRRLDRRSRRRRRDRSRAPAAASTALVATATGRLPRVSFPLLVDALGRARARRCRRGDYRLTLDGRAADHAGRASTRRAARASGHDAVPRRRARRARAASSSRVSPAARRRRARAAAPSAASSAPTAASRPTPERRGVLRELLRAVGVVQPARDRPRASPGCAPTSRATGASSTARSRSPTARSRIIEGSREWWRVRGVGPRARRQRLAAQALPAPRAHQHVLQTWHGTMLKRLALDRAGRGLRTRIAVLRERARWDVLLAQNAVQPRIFRSAYALRRPDLGGGLPAQRRARRCRSASPRSSARIGVAATARASCSTPRPGATTAPRWSTTST